MNLHEIRKRNKPLSAKNPYLRTPPKNGHPNTGNTLSGNKKDFQIS